MRVTLVQDEIYLPSLGGGTKANRYLLEALAERGHTCTAIARTCTRSPDGPNTLEAFYREMSTRGLPVREIAPSVFSFSSDGVTVEALDHDDLDQRRAACTERIWASKPDCIFVADDKRRYMLASALDAAPDRVVLLLQTIVQLPFGPLSQNLSQEYTDLMRRARSIVVISAFERDYIHEHSNLKAWQLPLPVYGKGPFPNFAKPNTGYVTLINPCDLKGLPIFVELTRRFPDVAFAAVPTWGANDEILSSLRELPNVTLLQRTDNIDEILSETRILLVPSLWPETFGYVAPEAMLRGIPVLASRIGGLPEAKLGVDYVLPATPGQWVDGSFVVPPQDVSEWADALSALLHDEATYSRCSQQSRSAALQFVDSITVEPFEHLAVTSTDRQASLHPEFRRILQQQPYSVELDGFTLEVDEDVFPPDLGQCAQNMAQLCQQYDADSALDMGCGSGYLALSLFRSGISTVWASDIHPPAVRCAQKNADRTHGAGAIHVLQSDLFSNFPDSIAFDLIVFNQPFGPASAESICGCGSDGGYEITKRFLTAAPKHLNSNGVIMMAFSDREPMEHSPDRVAIELGYPVKTILHKFYGGANNYIFEIRLPAS